jgi:pyruvate dehydrogenase complex dehydrogenase (E1) component
MANENNLKPAWQKGQSGNPNGRPKKFTTLLVENGYKRNEINDTIQSMLAMTIDELKSVYEDKQATILEKTIANALRKSLEKGTLYSIETLLNRTYGMPKQDIQTEMTVIDKFDFNGND